MSALEIKQVFTVNGINFDSKAEATNYLRRPKIEAALTKLVGSDNKSLTDWLVDNQEQVEIAFDSGTVKRVTKSESAKLAKALEAIVDSGDKSFAFIIENVDAIKDSFRWPSVKRMTDEEKVIAARNTLVAASGNEELAEWIIANKDAVVEAYQAGIVKREVSPKASEALAKYRAEKAAEKEAAEAAAEKASK
jgi:dsDNA-binding SOS-regulon protein